MITVKESRMVYHVHEITVRHILPVEEYSYGSRQPGRLVWRYSDLTNCYWMGRDTDMSCQTFWSQAEADRWLRSDPALFARAPVPA